MRRNIHFPHPISGFAVYQNIYMLLSRFWEYLSRGKYVSRRKFLQPMLGRNRHILQVDLAVLIQIDIVAPIGRITPRIVTTGI